MLLQCKVRLSFETVFSRGPHSAKMWWVVSVCLFAIVERALGYTGCTDTSLNYQGYTYTIDPSTQQKVWSHCGFPNPSFDYALCGLTYTSGEHFLCDPDGLLTTQSEYIREVTFNRDMVSLKDCDETFYATVSPKTKISTFNFIY